jgi:chromosome segregation ATPase
VRQTVEQLPVIVRVHCLALRDRMKSQFIEHEDQKQQVESIRQQLRAAKDQCDGFRLMMKRYQTNLLEYSHRILKVNDVFVCSSLSKDVVHRPRFNSNVVDGNINRD